MGIFTVILACLIGFAFGPLMLIIIEELDSTQSKKKKYKIQDKINMLNEAKWVEKVIKSCKTYEQLNVADTLLSILWDKYSNKVDNKSLNDINVRLNWVCNEMAYHILYD